MALPDHHPRGLVGSRAEAADAERFALEVFNRLELRLGDQRHRPIIEIPGDDSDRQARDGAADDRAEELAVVDVAGGEGRHRHVRIHTNDFGFEIFILEKPFFLRHGDRQVRHIRIRHRNANAINAPTRIHEG